MTNTQEPALAPCPVPWCKGEAFVGTMPGARYYVGCRDCDIKTPNKDSRRDAITLWNSRHSATLAEAEQSRFLAHLVGFEDDRRIKLCEPCYNQAVDDDLVIYASAEMPEGAVDALLALKGEGK